MKKILVLILLIITPVISGCTKETNMVKENISGKRAVLVIASQGFQDFEYSETKKQLDQAGIETIVAGSIKGEAKGKSGQRVAIKKTLEEIKQEDFDALVFIGGPGALEYVDDPIAHQLIKQSFEQEKLMAAICIAPEILAKAGVLKGKKATVWSSPIDQAPVEFLKENSAEYLDQEVVQDGNVITANGPAAASSFGEKIVKALLLQ